MYLVAALYRFVHLDKLHSLQAALRDLCSVHEVKGTLLLAEEGINGTVAGPEEGVQSLLEYLQSDSRFDGMSLKLSRCSEPPFREMKVKLKREIVTLGQDNADPRVAVGTYVSPKDWNALIRDPEVTLIDTRNTYESDIGTFKGAILPETEGFRDFPDWMKQEANIPKDRKVAMFCTGGIRCEKATAHLLSEGYEEVFHLEGGILRYLEEVPREESLWEGDCFVFDQRVSVDHDLAPGDHVMCGACGRAVDAEGRADARYLEGVSCAGCHHETTAAQKERFAERQRQVDLAESRGELHLGASFPQNKQAIEKPPLDTLPILYSFRRCPYAMRARMALAVSGQTVRLREVVLKDKPPSLIEFSPKATVPVLVLQNGRVLDESLSIMQWTLSQSDPESWLGESEGSLEPMLELIAVNDGEFKSHLDRYKYSTRYEDADPLVHREKAEEFIQTLENRLSQHDFLFGDAISLADVAIAPFVRQFGNADPKWFQSTPYKRTQQWLLRFVESERFRSCMVKHRQWKASDPPIAFP